MFRIALLIFIACNVPGGCTLESRTSEVLYEDYEIGYLNDVFETKGLYKDDKLLVRPYILKCFNDSNYLVLIQHPLTSDNRVDTSKKNYYIVTRTKSKSQDKPIYGPFTKGEYCNYGK